VLVGMHAVTELDQLASETQLFGIYNLLRAASIKVMQKSFKLRNLERYLGGVP